MIKIIILTLLIITIQPSPSYAGSREWGHFIGRLGENMREDQLRREAIEERERERRENFEYQKRLMEHQHRISSGNTAPGRYSNGYLETLYDDCIVHSSKEFCLEVVENHLKNR